MVVPELGDDGWDAVQHRVEHPPHDDRRPPDFEEGERVSGFVQEASISTQVTGPPGPQGRSVRQVRIVIAGDQRP